MAAINHNPRTETDARFCQVVAMLIEQDQVRSERDFCIRLGIHPATVYKVRTGLQSMPGQLPMDMQRLFNTEPDYVRFGKGVPFRNMPTGVAAPLPSLQPVVRMLPFVPTPARAGFVTDFLQGTPYQHLERVPIITDGSLGELEEAVIIEVEGTSMLPTLLPGDRLVVTPIHPGEWFFVHEGIYVVVLPDQVMVKRIGQNRLSTVHTLHLKSDNPEAGDLEVPAQYLKGLFKIRQLIRTL